ncbi:MAG: phosphatase PAP2 family protein [Tepidisphaeraceae bacterium]
MNPPRSARRRLAFTLAFLALFVAALAVDRPIANWVHQSGISAKMKDATGAAHYFIRYGLRFYGIFWFTIAACAVLLMLRGWQSSALVFLSGFLSLVNQPIKWCIGRTRPFHDIPPFQLHPFAGGWHGLIHAEAPLSFPSGDVTLAFAMTMTLSWAAPRLRALWWVLGLWIALERIIEGAHYPSDTVGGAALGIVCACVARRIIRAIGHYTTGRTYGQ